MARIPAEAGLDRIAEARVAGKGVDRPNQSRSNRGSTHGSALPATNPRRSATSRTVVGPDEHPAHDLTIDELEIIATPEEPARGRFGHGIITRHRREQSNRKLRIFERPLRDLDRPEQTGSTVEFVVHRTMDQSDGTNAASLEILRQVPRRHGPRIFDPDPIRVITSETIRRHREDRACCHDDRDDTPRLWKRP